MNSLVLRLIILALLSVPLVVEAQFEYSTEFTYVTNNGVITTNGTITITGYSGPGGTVTIPAELNGYPVANIGIQAFENDTTLTNVIVPDSVNGIGDDAFAYCFGLTNVSLGSGVTNIGGNVIAFGSHSSIGDNAFFDCTNLLWITVDPQNPVYSSTNGVMFNNQGTLIQFPPGLTGYYTISNGVTGRGFEAFATSLLNGVTIPDSVTAISSSAFEGCDNLGSFFIGSGVTSLVSSNTTVFGGRSVTTYSSLFASLPSLTNIIVDPDNPVFSSVNGAVFNKDQTTLVAVPCGLSGTYAAPGSVTVIGGQAFANCSSLTNVVLDYGLTNIEAQAFYGCSGLTAVYFEGGVPPASRAAFEYQPTVYYLPDAMGWSTGFDNLPTAIWLPQIQAAGAGIGAPASQFGFNINWASGQTVVVQVCADITNPVWKPIWTNTLAGLTTNFSDIQWKDYTRRFYRVADSDGQ